MKVIPFRLLVLVLSVLSVSCGRSTAETPTSDGSLAPPRAERIPHEIEIHDDTRIDDYYWLNERENPKVIEYLEAENAYTEAVMKPTEELQQELFEEIKGRIKQTDESVPYQLGGYWYYTRYEDGKEYPIHCRRKESMAADEEVILDVNVLAEGQDFLSASYQMSASHRLMAYSVDPVGRRIYTLRFRDLETGEELADVIPEVTGDVAWAKDDRTIFYSRQDLQTLRAYRVYRHVLGADWAQDELVYEEPDETYSMDLGRSRSRDFIFITSSHTERSEVRYLSAQKPEGEFAVFEPRGGSHEYSVDHAGDRFYIRTNDGAENFRLMSTPVSATGRAHWAEVIPHRPGVFLDGFEVFENFLVTAERKDGLRQIRVIPWQQLSGGEGGHYLEFDEPAYSVFPGNNPEFETDTLRYDYSSLTTPRSTFDYQMESRERTLLKQQEILGGFDSADYETERLWVPARDGVSVPVSLVFRKGFVKDGTAPLLLYAYGSYGASMDPSFNVNVLPLLDRGFAYAIAHVRGGQEMGRGWYDNGRMFHKKNTFTDFVDVGRFLVAEEYTSPDRLFARGGSAGGLLMGAVVNMAPDLFEGVVAHVPFVDVVTTMLDDTIPLTTFEWNEWGNPQIEEQYRYMLSYSPYDRVSAQRYPNLLVTTGLHDSQVQYFEPAKWVAKLRAVAGEAMADRRLLLQTNMEAGHGGASGRYEAYRETALEWAFLLDLLPEG